MDSMAVCREEVRADAKVIVRLPGKGDEVRFEGIVMLLVLALYGLLMALIGAFITAILLDR